MSCDLYTASKNQCYCRCLGSLPLMHLLYVSSTVAQRVAAERAESLGKSSGYQIRLERVLPREKGSILYCTTGVLLRRMLTDP